MVKEQNCKMTRGIFLTPRGCRMWPYLVRQCSDQRHLMVAMHRLGRTQDGALCFVRGI
jgi:hypothetical protein